MGGLKSVAEVDATEPVDLPLTGNPTRGKAVESAKQQNKSGAVNANFIFEIFPAGR